MAGKPKGWSLYRDRRTGHYIVRFTHEKKRHGYSTGTADRREAQKEAARIYAEVVSGRRRKVAGPSRVPFDELLGDWIAAMQAEVPDTASAYELYAFTHFEPFFKTMAHLTEPGIADYIRQRLRQVSRSTLKKELSALRRFLRWAAEEGHMAEPPQVPTPPRSALGTEYQKGKRRKVRVEIDAATAEAILAALPVRTRRGGHPAWAFYTVMWETGLRRGTLERLVEGRHYRPGVPELWIEEAIDKSRDERTIDITDRARAALDSVCTGERGRPLFGSMDLRSALRQAARAAGLSEHDARHLSNHDFRHARLTHWAGETQDLLALAFLAGHKHVTTTAGYVHARRSAARALVQSGNESGNGPTAPPRQPVANAGGNSAESMKCGRVDSNHHGPKATRSLEQQPGSRGAESLPNTASTGVDEGGETPDSGNGCQDGEAAG